MKRTICSFQKRSICSFHCQANPVPIYQFTSGMTVLYESHFLHLLPVEYIVISSSFSWWKKKKKKKKISLLCCMRSLTESTVFIITVALISLWICFKHLYFDQTVYVCLLVKKSKTSHLQRFQKNQEIFLLQIFGNISFGNIIFCKCYG